MTAPLNIAGNGGHPEERMPGMAAAYAWVTGGFALLAGMAAGAVWLLAQAAAGLLQVMAGPVA